MGKKAKIAYFLIKKLTWNFKNRITCLIFVCWGINPVENFIPRNSEGTCDGNYALILDEEECKNEATNLCHKGFVSTGNWNNVNQGCFVYNEWANHACSVYFNTKSGLNHYNDAHISVCKLASNEQYFLCKLVKQYSPLHKN